MKRARPTWLKRSSQYNNDASNDTTTLENARGVPAQYDTDCRVTDRYELRNEIREKSNKDETSGESGKVKNGVTRDGKIALGLCEKKTDYYIRRLIWIPTTTSCESEYCRTITMPLAQASRTARTLELVSRHSTATPRKYINDTWIIATLATNQANKTCTIRLLKRHAPHSHGTQYRWISSPDYQTTEGCNACGSSGQADEDGAFRSLHDTMKPEDLAASFVTHIIRPTEYPPTLYQTRILFTSQFWERVTTALGI